MSRPCDRHGDEIDTLTDIIDHIDDMAKKGKASNDNIYTEGNPHNEDICGEIEGSFDDILSYTKDLRKRIAEIKEEM